MPSLYDLFAAHPHLSQRKRRLFAVACCRRVFDSPFLDLAEQLADGLLDATQREQAEEAAYLQYVTEQELPLLEYSRERTMAARATLLTLAIGPFQALDAAAYARQSIAAPHGTAFLADAREEAEQCALFQEVMGPPCEVLPLWRAANDHAAENLARLIYEEKAWELLPVLADALEDAGCTHEDMIIHLRDPGPHIRGCWALDAVLGWL